MLRLQLGLDIILVGIFQYIYLNNYFLLFCCLSNGIFTAETDAMTELSTVLDPPPDSTRGVAVGEILISLPNAAAVVEEGAQSAASECRIHGYLANGLPFDFALSVASVAPVAEKAGVADGTILSDPFIGRQVGESFSVYFDFTFTSRYLKYQFYVAV
jgi:hypothetical protein